MLEHMRRTLTLSNSVSVHMEIVPLSLSNLDTIANSKCLEALLVVAGYAYGWNCVRSEVLQVHRWDILMNYIATDELNYKMCAFRRLKCCAGFASRTSLIFYNIMFN
jgi:hypothetical protein